MVIVFLFSLATEKFGIIGIRKDKEKVFSRIGIIIKPIVLLPVLLILAMALLIFLDVRV